MLLTSEEVKAFRIANKLIKEPKTKVCDHSWRKKVFSFLFLLEICYLHQKNICIIVMLDLVFSLITLVFRAQYNDPFFDIYNYIQSPYITRTQRSMIEYWPSLNYTLNFHPDHINSFSFNLVVTETQFYIFTLPQVT